MWCNIVVVFQVWDDWGDKLAMFIGEYHHNLDAKGRLIIPSKFRELLGDSFVIARGLDKCLYGYPMDEWKLIAQQLKPGALTKKQARDAARFLFSGASECEFDKQGRINMPAPLMEYANLLKECVTIGVSGRIEIWSKENWLPYLEDSSQSFEDFAESLEDF